MEIFRILKKRKAKILFIITHISRSERWQKQSSFINFLKENGLEDLIEKDKSNILKCQLVGNDAYGIKEIFNKIYVYFNGIKESGEVYNQSLIEQIKCLPTFDEKLKFIKSKTNLFDEFETKEDLITYGNKKSIGLITSVSLAAGAAGAIPLPFADIGLVISLIGGSLIKIGAFYGYEWKTIQKEDLTAIYNGELYTKKNQQKENNIIASSQKELLKIIGEVILKGIGTTIALSLDDFIKTIWGVGTTIGVVLGAAADAGIVASKCYNSKKYFESKCKADDGTIFFTTRCSEYEIIFRKFKQLQNYDIVYPLQ